MNLSVGIVGLPNVGKSTLFNAILKKQVAETANYPFCTIEPNVGVIEVPDPRLATLAKIVKTQKIIPAAVEFYDIAGLVKGAAQGEGLGNKFLSHIREVSLIVHVVRLFEDKSVAHVAQTIDPVGDIQTIGTELILADLTTLAKQTSPKVNASKEERALFALIQHLKTELNKGIPSRQVPLKNEERFLIHSLHLLTEKPVLYVFNASEQQLQEKGETARIINAILEKVDIHAPFLQLCARLENDVLGFTETEQKEFLKQYDITDTGLNLLITKAYEMLGLISFLTAGEKEVRAWTISRSTTARQAAGIIHSDFEKHFICADIVTFEDFVRSNGWGSAREQGSVKTVGKEYIMQDGEVVEFKVGV